MDDVERPGTLRLPDKRWNAAFVLAIEFVIAVVDGPIAGQIVDQ